MNKNKEQIKTEIFQKVAEYYAIGHKPKEFIPGKSKLPYAGRVYNEDELINLIDSSLEFWLTYGRYSEIFEKDIARYIGAEYAFLVNSGSSANLLAVAALSSPLLGDRRLNRGDEVITVAAGFPTTVSPLLQHGFVPVFVDVKFPHYNIDCAQLDEALSSKTRAVVLAHTLGNPFDIERVLSFCKKHDLWLIEDNCDALGSLYKKQKTGSFGHIATSSFYPPHHMTMGEGGAVYTSDPLLAKIIASLRDWGRDCTCPSGKDNTCGRRFAQQFGDLPYGYDHKYVYSHFGYNLKVSDMQAAIGCAQLKKLPGFVNTRRHNFNFLHDKLRKFSDHFILPEATEDSEPSWFGFLLTIKEGSGFTRDEIVTYLERKHIQTRMLFAGNLIKHPCFDEMRLSGKGFRVVGNLHNTDLVMNNTFWVGVYPGLTEEMLEYMTSAIEEFISSKATR